MKAKLGSEALKNDVTTKMRTLGFGAPTEAMWGNLNYLHREKNIFCVYTPDLIGEFRFSCSNLLWGSEDNLELLNSLAEAAKSKTGEYPSYISASLSNIKNSVNAPYQTITVSGASYGMLFYRVNPTAEWVYVTSGQDTPSCDVFKGDAAKAFEGLGCANYDTNKILTVKP
jgi:hypothetical protein